MFRSLLAGLFCAGLVLSPVVTTAWAQSTDSAAEKTTSGKKSKKSDEAKSAKKLTPQQQKMKDCGAKWQDEKKAKNVKGREAYRKFLSTCLKKT